jgi:hypothetical protein
VDFNVVSTVKGFETVIVPAGSFLNCLRQEMNETETVTLSSNHQRITATTVETRWLAPGVGPVKNTVVTAQSNDSSYSRIETEELKGYFIDGQGKGIMPQFTVASGSDTETPGKSIGFDGTNYLLVALSNGGSGLIGVTISGSGTGKILNTFQIVALPQGSQFTNPAIAYDGTNYLIVFQQNGQIFGIRVSPSGNVLDGPNGFSISTGSSNWAPVVAFDGTNYLVAWEKFMSNYDIYGARITKAGQSLGELPIFLAIGEQVEPSIAFDGNNYMVVWRDTRSGSGPSNDTDIYGTRVTKDGTILDPAGIPVSTAPGFQGEPNIIFDGTNYFVVWSDERNSMSYSDNDTYGTRMKTDGTLLDGPSDTGGIAINTTHNSGSASMSFDGTNYLVVSADPYAGIYGTRVSTNGSLVDGPSSATGASLSGSSPANSRYVSPGILFNGKNSLLIWVNNIELSGASKEIDGVLIYPY